MMESILTHLRLSRVNKFTKSRRSFFFSFRMIYLRVLYIIDPGVRIIQQKWNAVFACPGSTRNLQCTARAAIERSDAHTHAEIRNTHTAIQPLCNIFKSLLAIILADCQFNKSRHVSYLYVGNCQQALTWSGSIMM